MGRKPLKHRSVAGCHIPDNPCIVEMSAQLLDYWPVWDLADRLEKDGIVINRATFRPGWVKAEIDWWGAEKKWSQKLTAEIIRDVVAMCGNECELYFNHWQVLKPKDLDINSWTTTLSTAAREAIVYFRTELKARKSVHDLLQQCKRDEVNSIILASAFSLMEKEGVHDQD
jgi:hypothetical protein